MIPFLGIHWKCLFFGHKGRTYRRRFGRTDQYRICRRGCGIIDT